MNNDNLKNEIKPEKKKSNPFLSVIKAIGKGFYYVGASILYIVGALFCFNFIMDLFDNKKK